MKFYISGNTDIGNEKNVNQDGLYVSRFATSIGEVAFAVLCDGMGGHQKGEVASTTVISAFVNWARNQLPGLANNGRITDDEIRKQWENLITSQNDTILKYGKSQRITLGTTIVTILLTQQRYYIMNIGDSRAYEISDNLKQITNDQTFVAREIAQGRMTPEEAEVDPRRSILLQSVGASEVIYPDMFFGDTKENAVYMLCSDGFRHLITPDEIYGAFNYSALRDKNVMINNSTYLIELNKQRRERDNISVLLIKTEKE